jgi:hypothetical protein
MTATVLQLHDHRKPKTKPTPVEDRRQMLETLRLQSYASVVAWAGADFNRLVSVAVARSYYPKWVKHQLANRGVELTLDQERFLADLSITSAGHYLSSTERWILRELWHAGPMTTAELQTQARDAPPYAGFGRRIDLSGDLERLEEIGLIWVSRDGTNIVEAAPPSDPFMPVPLHVRLP